MVTPDRKKTPMMRCETLVLAVVATALASSPGAPAQPVSDMLEEGVFKEVTVGHLAAVIRIYETIAAGAEKNWSYAAQAQYRFPTIVPTLNGDASVDGPCTRRFFPRKGHRSNLAVT